MSGEVTHILAEWRAGDSQAVERLIPLVYEELRRLAGRQHCERVEPEIVANVHATSVRREP